MSGDSIDKYSEIIMHDNTIALHSDARIDRVLGSLRKPGGEKIYKGSLYILI